MAEIEDLHKERDALKRKIAILEIALGDAKDSYDLCFSKRSPFSPLAKGTLKGFFSYGQMFKALDGDDG